MYMYIHFEVETSVGILYNEASWHTDGQTNMTNSLARYDIAYWPPCIGSSFIYTE